MAALHLSRFATLIACIFASVILAILVTQHYFPLPPTQLRFAVDRGALLDAQQYRAFLQSQHGITTVIELVDAGDDSRGRASAYAQADVIFKRGTERTVVSEFVTLANVERIPVWLLMHRDRDDDLRQFIGGTVGYPQSQAFIPVLFDNMAKAYGIDRKNFSLQPIADTELLVKLRGDGVDLFIGEMRADSDAIQFLLRNSKRHIAYLEYSDSLSKKMANFSRITMPRATIDYTSDIPNGPRSLLVAHRQLMVRKTMHPALQRALLDAATQIHNQSTLISKSGDFPNFLVHASELSATAAQYAQNKRPWAEGVLTYWWAQLATLIIYAIVPFIAMVLMLFFVLNRLNARHTNQLLEVMFGNLASLESEIQRELPSKPILAGKYLRHLDVIDKNAANLSVPKACHDRWLTLRNHAAYLRARIFEQRGR